MRVWSNKHIWRRLQSGEILVREERSGLSSNPFVVKVYYEDGMYKLHTEEFADMANRSEYQRYEGFKSACADIRVWQRWRIESPRRWTRLEFVDKLQYIFETCGQL